MSEFTRKQLKEFAKELVTNGETSNEQLLLIAQFNGLDNIDFEYIVNQVNLLMAQKASESHPERRRGRPKKYAKEYDRRKSYDQKTGTRSVGFRLTPEQEVKVREFVSELKAKSQA